MNRLNSLKSPMRTPLGLALIVALLCGASLKATFAADPPPDKNAKPEKKAEQKTEKKKLTGAELYAINCNRCHAERYATEWTAAQWKTIMMHMRVRANLPAAQAKVILKYLQEDSGS